MRAACSPAVLARLGTFAEADLGPHAAIIMEELRAAAAGGLRATCVILAAALVDIVSHEEAGPAGYLDGMAFAYAGNKPALSWLRGRRNSLLHHEGPSDGLMGEAVADEWMRRDADRAITTLLDYLDDLDVAGPDID